MYTRILDLSLANAETCFLWGPRQAGKSTLLKQLFPESIRYDLLLSTTLRRFIDAPETLREECAARGLSGDNQTSPIIIDEVQKAPSLLDEVHWLIEEKGLRFILCGSSARKLKRDQANLLGGRAVRYELGPLVAAEIPDFDLLKALNDGLLPRHYDSGHSRDLLDGYVADYLKEEIAAEALVRNLSSFSRFLRVAAMCSAEQISYSNIARECGVTSPTVKGYFEILTDTLLGSFLPCFEKKPKRRVRSAPKFYFFDVGTSGFLARRGEIQSGSEAFGKAFEEFIYHELRSHRAYSRKRYDLSFWRTTSGFEVDFVLGDGEVAVEVKSSDRIHSNHQKGLLAFQNEYKVKRSLIVCMETVRRTQENGVEVWPWQDFIKALWSDEIIS
jgi:predicted AAA+ superfamily ATPase